MKCKHYKGEGYTYKLTDGQNLDLCEDCESDLLQQMKVQETIENKSQVLTNNELLERLEKLEQKKLK